MNDLTGLDGDTTITIQTTFGPRDISAWAKKFTTKDGVEFDAAFFIDVAEWNFTDPVSGGKIFAVDMEVPEADAKASFIEKMRGVTSEKFLAARCEISRTCEERIASARKTGGAA